MGDFDIAKVRIHGAVLDLLKLIVKLCFCWKGLFTFQQHIFVLFLVMVLGIMQM